jgi:hypothetical protein
MVRPSAFAASRLMTPRPKDCAKAIAGVLPDPTSGLAAVIVGVDVAASALQNTGRRGLAWAASPEARTSAFGPLDLCG